MSFKYAADRPANASQEKKTAQDKYLKERGSVDRDHKVHTAMPTILAVSSTKVVVCAFVLDCP